MQDIFEVSAHELSPEKGLWNEVVCLFSVPKRVTLLPIPSRRDGFGRYWVSVAAQIVRDHWKDLA
ncbi:MAG: hypothetical protein DRG82_13750 [Deltaproteobacteria bacterium]|nr:MAG: hypothetical protein DRG82_13750 [Deltaproteobacteria bacterium]